MLIGHIFAIFQKACQQHTQWAAFEIKIYNRHWMQKLANHQKCYILMPRFWIVMEPAFLFSTNNCFIRPISFHQIYINPESGIIRWQLQKGNFHMFGNFCIQDVGGICLKWSKNILSDMIVFWWNKYPYFGENLSGGGKTSKEIVLF